MRRALAAAALVLAAAVSAQAEPPFELKDGDRVVFYGDSITEQRLYTRYVQQYAYVRYPDRNIRFFNAGWGGDTAAGAGKRLERDVLELEPTVVTLFFGMNDGRYRSLDPTIVEGYENEISSLVERLQKHGVRVIVFSPGCVDYDRSRNRSLGKAKYNAALGALARSARRVAEAAKCTYVDMRGGMLDFQNAEKERNKHFTMIPDSVHPNAGGHLVMARLVLRTLGAEPLGPLGTIDVATGKTDGLTVESAGAFDVALVTTRPLPPPFWVEPGSLWVADRCGFLDDLGGQRLVVSGLKEPRYDLSVGDVHMGTHGAESLAAGISLAGTWSADAKAVHDLVAKKEGQYFRLWREFRVPLDGKEGLDAVTGPMLAANDGLHAMVRAQCRPLASARVMLSAVPEGENIARGRPFVSSDPNKFWRGLTDGNWGEGAGNCYATGNTDTWPKTVTIELTGNKKVAAVRLGVPAFGSTLTVAISVSRNGKKFTDVGKTVFGQGAANRRTVRFESRFAKYVRLTFPDRNPNRVVHDPRHLFVTEAEVYAP